MEKKTTRGLDPDLVAMGAIDAILAKLEEKDADAPGRVLAWINERWGKESLPEIGARP